MPVDVIRYCDYDYEAQVCYGCYGCETGEDYCRGAVYEGLTFEVINVRGVIARILSMSEDELSDEMIRFAVERGVEEEHNYEISTEPDYYGETVAITFSDDDIIEDLRRKFGRSSKE